MTEEIKPDKWGYLPADYSSTMRLFSSELREVLRDRSDATTWALLKQLGLPETPYLVQQYILGGTEVAIAFLLQEGYIVLTEKGEQSVNLTVVEPPEGD